MIKNMKLCIICLIRFGSKPRRLSSCTCRRINITDQAAHKLTCRPCPRGAVPNRRSASACSTTSDSSGSGVRRARPLSGLPRASCRSGLHETAGGENRSDTEVTHQNCEHKSVRNKLNLCFIALLSPAECANPTVRLTSLLLALKIDAWESQQGTHSVILTAGLPPERVAAIWVVLLFCL